MKKLFERCEVSMSNALKVFDNKITETSNNIETYKEKEKIKALRMEKFKIEQETLKEYKQYTEIVMSTESAREKHIQYVNGLIEYNEKDYMKNIDKMYDKKEINLLSSLHSKYAQYEAVLGKMFFHSLDKRSEFDINTDIKHDDFRKRIVNHEVEKILCDCYEEYNNRIRRHIKSRS